MLLLPAGRPGSVEFSESNQQAAESIWKADFILE
eukprot:COSAG04_NODE_492_length_13438_cov_2.453782_2_plen_34_part_00